MTMINRVITLALISIAIVLSINTSVHAFSMKTLTDGMKRAERLTDAVQSVSAIKKQCQEKARDAKYVAWCVKETNRHVENVKKLGK